MGSGSGGDGEGWKRLLETSGALTEGHFVLSSGLHSPAYVQCARLLEDPARARGAGEAVAAELPRGRIDSVLSPALGGVIIGFTVAAALGVPFRFTERKEGAMLLRRGFELAPGERVVIVEDVVTTGRSTRETMDIAQRCGASVVAVAAILDRSGGAHPFEVPLHALVELTLPTWRPEECPRCQAGEALERPGSRSETAG